MPPAGGKRDPPRACRLSPRCRDGGRRERAAEQASPARRIARMAAARGRGSRPATDRGHDCGRQPIEGCPEGRTAPGERSRPWDRAVGPTRQRYAYTTQYASKPGVPPPEGWRRLQAQGRNHQRSVMKGNRGWGCQVPLCSRYALRELEGGRSGQRKFFFCSNSPDNLRQSKNGTSAEHLFRPGSLSRSATPLGERRWTSTSPSAAVILWPHSHTGTANGPDACQTCNRGPSPELQTNLREAY